MLSDELGICYENNISRKVTFLFVFFFIFKLKGERRKYSLIKEEGSALNN